MEKIAVISDIHGNKQALCSVLADCSKRKVDRIFCLGDTTGKGIHQEECVNLVKKNCQIVVAGNCDEFNSKINFNFIEGMKQIDIKRAKWNQSIVSSENLQYLKELPFSHEFYLSGRLVRLFHATPTKINGTVISLDSIEKKYELFLPSSKTISQKAADIVLYGHIHQQFADTLYNKVLINVGSVGNSFLPVRNEKKDSNILETTSAQYVILEGDYGEEQNYTEFSFTFVRVPYDITLELEQQEENIEKEDYMVEIQKGIYRNMHQIEEYYSNIGIDMKKL